jgi:hypothetical protein
VRLGLLPQVVFQLATASSLSAQLPTALPPGALVRMVTRDSAAIVGQLVRVRGDTIDVRLQDSNVTAPVSTRGLLSYEYSVRKETASGRTGFLIGGGIGLGFVLAVASTLVPARELVQVATSAGTVLVVVVTGGIGFVIGNAGAPRHWVRPVQDAAHSGLPGRSAVRVGLSVQF